MNTGTLFPDESHVARIAAALWSRTPTGNAAVLVGAGFSRNARPVAAGANILPGWDDICRHIIDVLLPGADADSKAIRERLKGQLGAASTYLRLSQEFEAEFRRDALDQLIKKYVPDLQFAPGELHQMLLDLPWADILTTNWDTLLERSAELVEDRVYDVVRTLHDLPASRSPRIVKLNGSLPSHRPFIFTEEDFRTYPDRFAPFVNLARQTTMENLLVLVGFSGDDPNFQFWSGWVRDQLGEHAPLVYLVGALNLTSSKRKMLEQRRVQPIDLARLPEFAEWAPEKQHENATRWFLERLRSAKPYRGRRWPLPPAPLNPPLLLIKSEVRVDIPLAEEAFLSEEEDDKGVARIIEIWQRNRSLFPGWIIAPTNTQINIWMHTQHMLADFLVVIANMEVSKRLLALYELNWRLEIALIPLWWQIPSMIESAIFEGKNLEIEGFQDIICELQFALLRHLRETGEDDKFFDLAGEIELKVAHKPDEYGRLAYERCLQSLAQFDYQKLENLLASWKINGDPFWLIRKAGLLVEIGRLEEADRISNQARIEIRQRTLKGADDLASWSREAYALLLRSHFVIAMEYERPKLSMNSEIDEDTDNRLKFAEFQRAQFEERLDDIKSRGCDAKGDLETLVSRIDQEPPAKPKSETVRRRFDLGRRTVSRPLFKSKRDLFRERLDGVRVLRFQEECGLPPKIGFVGITSFMIERAAIWLSQAQPYRAIVAYLRVCSYDEDKNFDVIFARRAVAKLSEKQAEVLVDRLFSLVVYARKILSGADKNLIWIGRFRVAIELLSRLVLRRGEAAEQLFNFGVDLYQDKSIARHPWFVSSISNLLERSLESMSAEMREEQAIKLLRLPLIDEGTGEQDRGELEDPFLMLPRNNKTIRFENNVEWTEIVVRLVAALAVHSTRDSAARRLLKLFSDGLLNEHEQGQVAEALWSWPDRKYGLPGGTNLLEWVFAALPHPDDSDAIKSLRSIILKRPDDMDFERWMKNVRSAISSYHPVFSIDLSCDEIASIFYEFVHHLKRIIPPRDAISGDAYEHDVLQSLRFEASRFFALLVRLLVKFEAFPLVQTNADTVKNLLEWEAAVPSLVAVGLFRSEEGAALLNKVLQESDKLRTVLAAEAVKDWTIHPETMGEVPRSLLTDVALIISTRRAAALAPILDVASEIYRRRPEVMNAFVDELISSGLEKILLETDFEYDADDVTYDAEYVRSKAAHLASRMLKAKRGDLKVLSQWASAVGTDPLPDIRNAFESADYG